MWEENISKLFDKGLLYRIYKWNGKTKGNLAEK